MNTPRLIKWANDGYPPINLNNELKAVTELIRAYKELESKYNELCGVQEKTSDVVIIGSASIGKTVMDKFEKESIGVVVVDDMRSLKSIPINNYPIEVLESPMIVQTGREKRRERRKKERRK
jgi:hypothetical protein